MSQVDRLHFFSSLIWVIILYVIWYVFISGVMFPSYYKVMRGRVLYENEQKQALIALEYNIKIFRGFFSIWMNMILKRYNIFILYIFFKNIPLIEEDICDSGFVIVKRDFSIEENQEEKDEEVQVENIDDIGYVLKVSDDIVYARGLLKAQMSEMVSFTLEDGEILFGIVNYLDNEGVAGITVLGDATGITAQTIVSRTMKQPEINGGYNVLGRVLNPLGEPLDGLGIIESEVTVNIEKNAPSIIERKPVREPLETGVKFIDSMIPIGCGQRELIIGDKKTGKTAIAIDTILNQKGNDIICIYVAIGQKKSSIARVAKILRERECIDYTIIVASSASDSAALQYLAPYSGCALGEFFYGTR